MCNNTFLNNRLNQFNSSSVFESLIKHNQWDILIKMFRLNILNVNIRDCKGRNALYFAIIDNKIDIIKDLLDLRIERFVSPNFLAMNFAVYLDNIKAISALKNCGFDVDEVDEINSTPLIYAILYNKQKSIDFLIRNGANIEHEDFMGNCAKNLLKTYR